MNVLKGCVRWLVIVSWRCSDMFLAYTKPGHEDGDFPPLSGDIFAK